MKIRMRVKGSSRAAKLMGGSSSSSNPKSTKHRSMARAQRLANICPLISVDERIEDEQRTLQSISLLQQLPLNEMSLGEEKRQQKLEKNQKQQQTTVKQETTHESTLLEQLSSSDISLDNKRRLLKKEHQIWQILPAHLSTSSPDYQATMPILAPILGAALNERPDLRLTCLASIRAALKMDNEHGFSVMERFAKNFLPILFSIYTNDAQEREEEQGEEGKRVDPKAVHLSTLETIRLYSRQMPKPLLKQYISVALQKLTGPDAPKGQIPEKNLLLADLLIAMCISADADDLQTIFICLEQWFDGRIQKKAYRLLAQIYQRIAEPELKPFFDSNRPFLNQLIDAGIGKVTKSAYQWRIAIYRNVIDSFEEFTELSTFCERIYEEIITFMDTSNSTPTRQQAANCLMEMGRELLRMWTLEGMTSPMNPLDTLFGKLFQMMNTTGSAAPPPSAGHHYQCALIALNILTQKQLKNANASLVSRLVNYSAGALQISHPKCRELAIRLVRTICTKMPPFMFDQYKDLILKAIFAQSTSDPTVRIRKSNALLLNLLLDRLGVEELLKFTGAKLVWTKMLKNLEKMRRRRQRREGGHNKNNGVGPILEGANWIRRSSRSDGASSVISGGGTSALSSLISLDARTAHADSIFDILGDSSDEEDADEHRKSKSRQRRHHQSSHRLSVVIEEGGGGEDDDDPLDLLDRKALESKISVLKQKDLERREKKRKLDGIGEEEREEGPFRVNKEGKLLISDLDGRKPKKARRKVEEEIGDDDDEKGKKKDGKNASDDDDGDGED